MSDAEFWAGVERSARLVRGLPKWTQAGLVLSHNFVGGEPQTEESDLSARTRSGIGRNRT
jgi:hypothetical protein